MILSENHHKPMTALSLLRGSENILDFSAQIKISSEQIIEGQKGLLPGTGEATTRARDAYLDRTIRMEMLDDISLLTAVARELKRPYSIDALASVIRRWSMLSIDLKSVERAELPSELKDIPALIKRMREGPTNENADNQKVPVAGH